MKYEGTETDFKQFPFLKVRLFLLLVVMVVPFIVFTFFKAADIREKLVNDAQRENIMLSKAIAGILDDYIESTGELLISLSNNRDVRSSDFPIVNVWFKESLEKYPYYMNIIFVDMKGNIRAAGRQPKPGTPTINVSDTAYYRRAMKTNQLSIGDFMYGKISGKPVVHITYPVFDNAGNKIGFVAAALDLTKIQNKLIQTKVSKDIIISVYDDKGTLLATNIDPEKWVGKDFSNKFGLEEMYRKKEGLQRVISIDGVERIFGFSSVTKAPWYVRVGLDVKVIETQISEELSNHFTLFLPLFLVAFFGWLWISRDVEKLHRRTEYLSLIDPLTELWNFRKLHDDLEHELNRYKRYEQPFSFAMIDIDNFKEFNDRHGHLIGNKALSAISQVILESVRDADTVYRYGGEEICVLMPSTDKQGALILSERIREAIEKQSLVFEKNCILEKITVSIGIASFPEDSVTIENLLRRSDKALYVAKQSGKNRVEVFTEKPAVQ